MLELYSSEIGSWTVRVVATERSDGDMHPERVAPETLAARQRAATGREWPMLDQVHGIEVVVLASTGRPPACDFPRGDIVVTPPGGTPVAVWAADCAPVCLIGGRGSIAMVHAGWRGLGAGVLDIGVDVLARADGGIRCAVLGPTIHSCCYEFGDDDLLAVATGAGIDPVQARGQTSWGTPALDVPSTVRSALDRRAVTLASVGPCTGCDDRWYSFRRRADVGRHALVAWTEQR